jgi:hypothetical protein
MIALKTVSQIVVYMPKNRRIQIEAELKRRVIQLVAVSKEISQFISFDIATS